MKALLTEVGHKEPCERADALRSRLLVGRQRDEQVAAGWLLGEMFEHGERRGHAGLHVEHASAEEPAAAARQLPQLLAQRVLCDVTGELQRAEGEVGERAVVLDTHGVDVTELQHCAPAFPHEMREHEGWSAVRILAAEDSQAAIGQRVLQE